MAFSEREIKDAREAAYLALLAALREEGYISEFLERWRRAAEPDSRDYDLAYEIAYGSARKSFALDYIAEQLTDKGKLVIKLKERALLRIAIYQYVYLDRLPIYAITDEAVALAKKHCHRSFANFLNATLRKLSEGPPSLPEGDTIPEMSIRYSYPTHFVEELVNNYGLENAKNLMELGNMSGVTMVRVRPHAIHKEGVMQGLELLKGLLTPVGVLKDKEQFSRIANSPDYYIQNVTPSVLIDALCDQAPIPKRLLDLCASPGGKLLSIYDHFPEAVLYANDVSEKKLDRLASNCEKYGLEVNLSCSLGEEYKSTELFDLVLLDVPCSNSGVYNKRPEARWRLNEESLDKLEETQMKLIEHATTLIKPEGEIWYMTCSILKRENERLVDKACQAFGLKIRKQEVVLPSDSGFDGGFSCALVKLQ